MIPIPDLAGTTLLADAYSIFNAIGSFVLITAGLPVGVMILQSLLEPIGEIVKNAQY